MTLGRQSLIASSRAQDGRRSQTSGRRLRILLRAATPPTELKRAGAKTAFFLPVWRITLLNRSNLRDHRKIAVFDGVRVFAGGRNLADEYLGQKPNPKRWADLSFVLEGPAAAHYEEIFRYDWAFATGEKLAPMTAPAELAAGPGNAVIQVVPSGPDVADDSIFAGMLSFIFAARQRVWIVTPYFIPNEMLAEALEIAVRRGVDVRVIVPEKSDQILVDLARGPYLRDLKALGSAPLLYTPSMIHGKAVLVDDVAAAIGSANFDARSMFLNFEVTSIVHSAPEVREVEGLDKDAHGPDTNDGWQGQPRPRYRRGRRALGHADALSF